jgi:Alpha galactosidase C-terminal beta sandwich domain/Alpha galactosidase A
MSGPPRQSRIEMQREAAHALVDALELGTTPIPQETLARPPGEEIHVAEEALMMLGRKRARLVLGKPHDDVRARAIDECEEVLKRHEKPTPVMFVSAILRAWGWPQSKRPALSGFPWRWSAQPASAGSPAGVAAGSEERRRSGRMYYGPALLMATRPSTPGISLPRLALASLATVATVACGSKGTSGASAAPESQSDAGTLDTADAATLDAAWDSAPLDPTALGVDPPMGWSSWSFLRVQPTQTAIVAQATALSNQLSAHGYVFVNIDDFYYLDPTQTVDAYGRWVVDSLKFPDGLLALSAFVHNLGLRFGLYVTPGIPLAAVNQNTPIEGTSYHAADIAIPSKLENQYNIAGSMVYIDYTKPGAQAFIDSWAKLLASYGVDYLKIDGVGTEDIPDVQAWSQALKGSGRVIHLELSNSLAKASGSTWESLANGWRIDGDLECYCSLSPYPLTTWANVALRFTDVVGWQPFSHAGGRNDLDAIEIGNGDTDDGLTGDEKRSQMTLWALSAAPLLLGVDLTNLDPTDLALLTNDEVIAIDQAGVAATQVTAGSTPVWMAPQPDGSLAVGLFNLGADAGPVSVSFSDLGVTGDATVRDVWAQSDAGSFSGSFQVTLPSHGVSLIHIAQ